MRAPNVALASLPFAMACLLAAACEQAPKEKTTPTPKATPIAPAETSDSADEPTASRPAPNALIDVMAEEVHIGRLVLNEPLSIMHPSEYCLDDGKLWQGSLYRLGRTNVFGLATELAAVKGTNPIAIFGEEKQSLDSKLVSTGPCPNPYEPIHVQMRSDWVAPEGGPNSTHEKLQGLPYIEGKKVQAVHMTEHLEGDANTARLRLRNPFSVHLSGVSVKAHYEGGGGKPMPTMVEQVLALAPGEWTEISLPKRLNSEQPRTKAGSGLHSLELRGQLGKAQINIEIYMPHE
ncbi:MAG: hypothetical protein GY811_16040 [Myxococcales bacterium]|nr:hypothetical protein [Myxococcales bacterium]